MDTVVASNLKVYGIENLRVVDARVILTLSAGHLKARVHTLPDKAADIIASNSYSRG